MYDLAEQKNINLKWFDLIFFFIADMDSSAGRTTIILILTRVD